jgi:hypothetical protein
MKGAIIWQKQEAEANEIGDEYHYIMSCGAIKGDRRKLLPNTYSPFDFYKSPEKILKNPFYKSTYLMWKPILLQSTCGSYSGTGLPTPFLTFYLPIYFQYNFFIISCELVNYISIYRKNIRLKNELIFK